MVDAVSGDGLIGLDGFVSELNVLIKDKASGIGAAFALLENVMPPAPLWRRIVKCYPVLDGSVCPNVGRGSWREYRMLDTISHGTTIQAVASVDSWRRVQVQF